MHQYRGVRGCQWMDLVQVEVDQRSMEGTEQLQLIENMILDRKMWRTQIRLAGRSSSILVVGVFCPLILQFQLLSIVSCSSIVVLFCCRMFYYNLLFLLLFIISYTSITSLLD